MALLRVLKRWVMLAVPGFEVEMALLWLVKEKLV